MKKLAAVVLLAAMWGVPAPVAAQVPTWTNPEQTVRIDRGFYLFWHESQGATGFDIEIRARSGGEWGEWSPVAHSGTDQPAIVTGLTEGTTYQWRIRGTRGTERGRWSTYDDDTDKAYTRVARAYGTGVPNPPTLDSVTESEGTVTVNWRLGEPRDGITVTGYEVTWRHWVDGVSHESNSQRLPASARSYVINEPLLVGTYYEASVNAVADGKLSAESSNQLEFVPTELSQGSPLSFDGATESAKTYTVGARVDWARSNAADQGMPRLPEAGGGGRTLTYSIEGLPEGLFMRYDRVLRGTPTAATDGPVTVTYTVADEHSASDSLTFEVTVNPALTFDPADVGAVPVSAAFQPLDLFEWGIHDCAVGVPINVVLPPAYGGTGTLTYQLSDNDTARPLAQVVGGLSFDTATRTLSGTPTTAGRYAITYWSQDRNRANVSSYSSIAFAHGVENTGICEASSPSVAEEQAPDALGAQLDPSIIKRRIPDQDPASAQQALRQQPEQPVPQRPGPVADLQLSTAANTVTVAWQAPTSGDAPDRYIVHLTPADGGKGETRRPKAAKQKVIFRNLTSGTAYNIWVRAKNEGGKGERVHAAITVE